MTRLLAATVPVVAAILLIGALADFGDPYSRTAYGLGVVAATLGYLVGDWAAERV